MISIFFILALVPPSHALNLYEKAEQAVERGDHREGAKTYELFAELYPEDALRPAALISAAWSYIKADEFEEAVRILGMLEAGGAEELMELFLYTRGYLASRMGEDVSAIKHFARLEKEYPDADLTKDGAMLLAENLNRLRRYNEAISVASRSLEREPGNARAMGARYDAYLGNGDFESALNDLNRLILILPPGQSQERLFQKVALLERMGSDISYAVKEYQRLYPYGPHIAQIDKYASDLASDNQIKRAFLARSLKRETFEPRLSASLMALANLSVDMGDTLTAVRAWKEILLYHERTIEAEDAALSLFEFYDKDLIYQDERFLLSLVDKVTGNMEQLESTGLLGSIMDILTASHKRKRAIEEMIRAEQVGPAIAAPISLEVPEESLKARAIDLHASRIPGWQKVDGAWKREEAAIEAEMAGQSVSRLQLGDGPEVPAAFRSRLLAKGPYYKVRITASVSDDTGAEEFLRGVAVQTERLLNRMPEFAAGFDDGKRGFKGEEAKYVDIQIDIEASSSDEGMILEARLAYPSVGAEYLELLRKATEGEDAVDRAARWVVERIR